MRRSKLEMYVDVLKVLAHKGPLKLTHIMYKANVNCSVLKEYLDFLIEQELVEEQTVGKNRKVYAITDRGITVSNTSENSRHCYRPQKRAAPKSHHLSTEQAARP